MAISKVVVAVAFVSTFSGCEPPADGPQKPPYRRVCELAYDEFDADARRLAADLEQYGHAWTSDGVQVFGYDPQR